MNVKRVQDLILFALGTAGEADNSFERELGPIHILKYIYLADLSWASVHGGETWTGIPWHFHHFGPWDIRAWKQIEPTVREAGGGVRMVSVASISDDRPRYVLADASVLRGVSADVPLEIRRAIKAAVQRFGADTAGLLEHVYNTRPMTAAAPEEPLDFQYAIVEPPPMFVREPSEIASDLSVKQRKRQREAVETLGAEVRARLAGRRARRVVPDPAPRYDTVYEEGARWLEGLEGEPVGPSQGTLVLDESVWHSETRSADVP